MPDGAGAVVNVPRTNGAGTVAAVDAGAPPVRAEAIAPRTAAQVTTIPAGFQTVGRGNPNARPQDIRFIREMFVHLYPANRELRAEFEDAARSGVMTPALQAAIMQFQTENNITNRHGVIDGKIEPGLNGTRAPTLTLMRERTRAAMALEAAIPPPVANTPAPVVTPPAAVTETAATTTVAANPATAPTRPANPDNRWELGGDPKRVSPHEANENHPYNWESLDSMAQAITSTDVEGRRIDEGWAAAIHNVQQGDYRIGRGIGQMLGGTVQVVFSAPQVITEGLMRGPAWLREEGGVRANDPNRPAWERGLWRLAQVAGYVLAPLYPIMWVLNWVAKGLTMIGQLASQLLSLIGEGIGRLVELIAGLFKSNPATPATESDVDRRARIATEADQIIDALIIAEANDRRDITAAIRAERTRLGTAATNKSNRDILIAMSQETRATLLTTARRINGTAPTPPPTDVVPQPQPHG